MALQKIILENICIQEDWNAETQGILKLVGEDHQVIEIFRKIQILQFMVRANKVNYSTIFNKSCFNSDLMNVTPKIGSRNRLYTPKKSNVKIFDDTEYTRIVKVSYLENILKKFLNVQQIPISQIVSKEKSRRSITTSSDNNRPRSLILQRVQDDDQNVKPRSLSR